MTSNSTEQCPAPFLNAAAFPSTGGYIRGRICSSVFEGGAECCLPCPNTDFLYPASFYEHTRIPGFISIASLLLCAFMLISFTILPKEVTRRQYLNVCLTIAILSFELGLTIPVLARPLRCFNDITPTDGDSNMTCAWSGALIIAGGTAMNMWTFIRTVSMHLLICWDFAPGKRFTYTTHAFAWGVTAILVAVCYSVTGVSNRFGDYCLVNHYKALDTLWGPLLAFATITMLLQVSTIGYCLRVYMKNLGPWRNRNISPNSPTGSDRRRAIYSRIKQVLQLQWRSMALSSIMLIYVIYFSIVFVVLDNNQASAMSDAEETISWIACLVEHPNDTKSCQPEASKISVRESTLIATLILFAIMGFQACVLMGRSGMITGWFDKQWRQKTVHRCSAKPDVEHQRDENEVEDDKTTYEMVGVETGASGTRKMVAVPLDSKRESRRVSASVSSVPDVDFDFGLAKEYGGGSASGRARDSFASSSTTPKI